MRQRFAGTNLETGSPWRRRWGAVCSASGWLLGAPCMVIGISLTPKGGEGPVGGGVGFLVAGLIVGMLLFLLGFTLLFMGRPVALPEAFVDDDGRWLRTEDLMPARGSRNLFRTPAGTEIRLVRYWPFGSTPSFHVVDQTADREEAARRPVSMGRLGAARALVNGRVDDWRVR
jgi:hypothetical protein